MMMMMLVCGGVGEECVSRWHGGKRAALCAGRNLTALPSHLEPDTQELDLAHNRLEQLARRALSSAGLNNLQRLDLSACRLRAVHQDAFHSLGLLASLDLSHNLLESVDAHWFEPTPRLRYLRLDGNRIARLGARSFLGLGRLRSLLVNGCGVAEVDPAAFVGLESSLESLELADNALAELSVGTVAPLGALRWLEVGGNPWRCGCGLAALRGWAAHRRVAWRVEPRCDAAQAGPREAQAGPCA